MSAEKLNLRIIDIDDGDHSVPAEILINVLKHLQQSVYLIAMDSENLSISERARANEGVRKTYALRCNVPVSGSYALPLTLGDTTGDLFAQQKIAAVGQNLEASLDAIATGSTKVFNGLFHSVECRNRVAESVKSLLPKAGENWKIGFSRFTAQPRPEVVLSAAIHKHMHQMIRPVEPEVVPQTVNGYLHAMDFAHKSITILHPYSSKYLECYYDESLEIELVEHRRELVQVTGTVVLGQNDEIKEIVNVESIEAVDMSDFSIESIPHGDGIIKPKSPLVLKPTLNESKQLLCIEDEKLGINVFGFTREKLLEELQEQVIALWVEYALEDDSNLTPSARLLKKQLLASFEEAEK